MKNVLIVDDEVKFTSVLKRFLEKYNVDVDIRHNVLDSHKTIISKKYDLILLDFNMPTYKGTKLVDTLKLTDANVKTPIVMISAYLNTQVVNELRSKGVQEFIEKPINLELFHDRIGRFLLPQPKQKVSE